jgi:hypothetical protein
MLCIGKWFYNLIFLYVRNNYNDLVTWALTIIVTTTNDTLHYLAILSCKYKRLLSIYKMNQNEKIGFGNVTSFLVTLGLFMWAKIVTFYLTHLSSPITLLVSQLICVHTRPNLIFWFPTWSFRWQVTTLRHLVCAFVHDPLQNNITPIIRTSYM